MDSESPIDEWIAIGFHRGLMTGAACALCTIAIIMAALWMF